MITIFKIFEKKVRKKWYANVIYDKDIEYFYDKIKKLNIESRFYKLPKDESIIFVYIDDDIKKNNFLGWLPQSSGDFMEIEGKVSYDPKIFLKELELKNKANKYNL